MSIERVKYFSPYDKSLFLYLPRIAAVMDNYPQWKDFEDVNDIIELYCIKLILDIEFETSLWSKNQKSLYLERKKNILQFIGRYFSVINDITIDNIINTLESQYIHFFWHLFDFFLTYERVSPDKIRKLLDESKISISDILHSEKTVNQYNEIIKNYLINHVECADLLITEYLEKHEDDFIHYYFPKSLSIEEKLSMVDQYIDSPDANINSLKLLTKNSDYDQLKIEPKIKLRARRKYDEKIDTFLSSGNSSKYSFVILIQPLDESPKFFSQEGNTYFFKYDWNWIIENQDYPTLLNNFLYLFEFTDLCFRWNHTSKKNMLSLIDLFDIQGKDEYRTGLMFNFFQRIADGQMVSYERFLSDHGINLEIVIKWFFETYIPEKFGINGFTFNVSSSGTNYLEKCRNLVIEIDKILKLFAMYSSDGVIDQELFEIKTEPMKIQNIYSCLPKKYIYPQGKDIENILHLLFSNQSLMLFTNNNKNHYKNSYQALLQDQTDTNDLFPHQLRSVNYLVDKKILSVDKNGSIIYDHALLGLLNDLYNNEVSCNYHLKNLENQIQFLLTSGMINFGATLLSKPEQDYFNYIFNNSEHGNALGLRNKYAHGNQPNDEEKIKKDYYTILRMLILIVMKINDEFWTLFDNKLLQMK